MGWAEIKKAINSNLSKPLNTLIEEKTNYLYSTIRGVQTEVEKSGKYHTVFRDTGYLHVWERDMTEKIFRHSGSHGELMVIALKESRMYDLSKIELKLDGVRIDLDGLSLAVNGDFSSHEESPKVLSVCTPLEFKNSIEIKLPSYQTDYRYKYIRCLFKTEK